MKRLSLLALFLLIPLENAMIKSASLKLLYAIYLIFLLPSLAFALPAFPGAEGMGASTVGGRGGTVYKVTNLNDSGAGSFRDAVSESNRIIVFTVSGVIHLSSAIQIGASNLTIAGQTSPGGICTADYHVDFGYPNHGVHDIIVTHMRFRTGPLHETAEDPGYTAIAVNGGSSLGGYLGYNSATHPDPTYNILFDHCSFSWANDTNININLDVYNVTFSWCYITDPLQFAREGDNHHNLGMLVWGRYNSYQASGGVTIHHSYFGDCYYRVPETNYNGFTDQVNNVNYHVMSQASPGIQPGDTSKYAYANIVGCYIDVRHSDTNDGARNAYIVPNGISAYQAVYMSGCYQSSMAGSTPAWNVGNYDSGWGLNLISEDWKMSSPRSVGTGNSVTATTMNSTYASTVVAGAGANRVQKTTDITRDSVDAAAKTKYDNNTGAYTSASAIDGTEDWPTYTGDAWTDTDSDGMPDSTELEFFGTLSNAAGDDADGDGYTNIEEVAWYLGGYQGAEPTMVPNINCNLQ